MAKKKLSDFQPQRQNANKHNSRGMGMLDNAIAKNGWITAITTAADGEAIDGSARLETAYTRFGEEVEPIVVRSKGDRPIIHIREDIASADDPRAKELSIAANRIAEANLDWDAEVLTDWQDEEIDLSQFWTDEELKIELGDVFDEPQISDEEDEENTADLIEQAESGKIESRVKLGEIWQLGRHRIACGDSTDEGNVRKLLGDRFGDVGMVWSDPPYGVSYQNNAVKRFEVIENDDKILVFAPIIQKVLRDGTAFFVWTKHSVYPIWRDQFQFGYKSTVIWNKGGGGKGDLKGDFMPTYEMAIFGSKGRFEFDISPRPSAVWDFSKDAMNDYVHPTQKPVALVEFAFAVCSRNFDTIFDPFLGSAPSIIAAQKMEGDRTVYGFELSPDYCEVICRRYEQFTGQNAKLVGHL